jgi:hypothetical protein
MAVRAIACNTGVTCLEITYIKRREGLVKALPLVFTRAQLVVSDCHQYQVLADQDYWLML